MSSRPRHSSDAPPTSADDPPEYFIETAPPTSENDPTHLAEPSFSVALGYTDGGAVTSMSTPEFRDLPDVGLPPGASAHLPGGKIRIRSVAADDPLASSRVRYLVEAFGGSRLAELTGVNRSQPTRWASGDERPGPAAAPLLIDLEHILAKARLVWGEHAAHTWLISANSYLNGARPLDALRMAGPAAVLDALDGEMWGGAR